MPNLTSMISSILGSLYGIYQDQRNWRKMAPSKKEELSFADAINDENATLAYLRQREYQEDYLTPEAQLLSQARGLDAVGLNRMALAGNAPGATSASSPQSAAPGASGNPGISDVLGPLMQFAALKQQKELQEYSNETARINAETEKFKVQTEAFLTREKWRAEQIRNKYLEHKESATLDGILLANSKTTAEYYQIKANTNKVLADTKYQEVLTKFAPRLFESQIKERESLSTLNYERAHEVEMLTIKHSHEIAQIDALRDKLYNEATLVLTQDRLTEQYIEESMKRCEKFNKEIEQIGKSIGLTEKDLEYYDWNHPRQTSFAGFRTNESYRPQLRW